MLLLLAQEVVSRPHSHLQSLGLVGMSSAARQHVVAQDLPASGLVVPFDSSLADEYSEKFMVIERLNGCSLIAEPETEAERP